jgi:hypothetical protein
MAVENKRNEITNEFRPYFAKVDEIVAQEQRTTPKPGWASMLTHDGAQWKATQIDIHNQIYRLSVLLMSDLTKLVAKLQVTYGCNKVSNEVSDFASAQFRGERSAAYKLASLSSLERSALIEVEGKVKVQFSQERYRLMQAAAALEKQEKSLSRALQFEKNPGTLVTRDEALERALSHSKTLFPPNGTWRVEGDVREIDQAFVVKLVFETKHLMGLPKETVDEGGFFRYARPTMTYLYEFTSFPVIVQVAKEGGRILGTTQPDPTSVVERESLTYKPRMGPPEVVQRLSYPPRSTLDPSDLWKT